jgi:RNA polymerase sigma-70 factor, ECF subfamily
MEEMDLIQLAAGGDLDAFNQLVLQHQGRVYNLAYRILGHSQTAEDVTQDTFLNAFLKLNTYRGGSFKSWLMRIASNLCYDQIRREKSRPTTPLEPNNGDGEELESAQWLVDPSPSPSSQCERAEFWDDIQELLNRLPPEYRTAVVLVDIQEMDYTGAAAAMGVSLGTMKSRLVRGRLKLREMMKKRDILVDASSISLPVGSACLVL